MRRLSDPRTTEEELMSVLGLFMLGQGYFDREVGSLSGGERARLVLASLFLARCNFLVLDEPTNHLDLETMGWLETYLKTYRGAVLVVSHDRFFLDAICTRIWELRGKTIKTYRGNYSAYLPQREAADERQQKQHEADMEKAAKLQDYIDRNLVRASTTKMAQSRRKQLEKLEITEDDINAEYDRMVKDYGMELEKVKSIVPVEEIKKQLTITKAAKVITDSAVVTQK